MSINGENGETTKRSLDEILLHKKELLAQVDEDITYHNGLLNGGMKVSCWWDADPECLGESTIGGDPADKNSRPKMFLTVPNDASDGKSHTVCYKCRSTLYRVHGVRAPNTLRDVSTHLYGEALQKKRVLEDRIKDIERQISLNAERREKGKALSEKLSDSAKKRKEELREKEEFVEDEESNEQAGNDYVEEAHLVSHIRGMEHLRQ